MGNQPHFKLQAATADELVFEFDGGTNFAPATDTSAVITGTSSAE